MLRCEDLDSFTDRLCDLTREMSGLERVREATDLLELIEQVPQRFVMQWRAAAVADLHYLEGMSLREIAASAGRAFQGTSQWLQRYGPSHYLTLAQDGGQIQTGAFAIDGEQTKVQVRKARAAGRIVVPAVKNVYDHSTGGAREGVDLQELWDQLSQPS